jgi:UDP-N-acetylmuramoyl-tripeptide--D-alanyl-D-alanine ligase
VLATAGNLNNEIGVPLTLLALHPALRYAVIEMGAAKPGDIALPGRAGAARCRRADQCAAGAPAGFREPAAVAATKGEIYDALGPDGIAVLNVDEPFADAWLARIGARTVLRASASGRGACRRARRGRATAGGLRTLSAWLTAAGCGDVRLGSARRAAGRQRRLRGRRRRWRSVSRPEAIRAGLQAVVPVAGRMQPRVTTRGALLIDDSYNANPGSVRAAIDSLVSFDGERVLVLGAMAELGAGSRDLHREVGAHARLRGVTQLFACGEHAEALAAGFGTGARIFASHEELTAACRSFDRPGCVILVKGSRAAAMERVVDALVDADPGVAGAGRH